MVENPGISEILVQWSWSGLRTIIARLYHGAGRLTEFLAIPAFMLGVCEQVEGGDAGFFCSVMYRRESASTQL